MAFQNTYMLARIEAGDQYAVAFFVQECRGEALIAAGASAFEWIESHGMHRLHAFA